MFPSLLIAIYTDGEDKYLFIAILISAGLDSYYREKKTTKSNWC